MTVISQTKKPVYTSDLVFYEGSLHSVKNEMVQVTQECTLDECVEFSACGFQLSGPHFTP